MTPRQDAGAARSMEGGTSTVPVPRALRTHDGREDGTTQMKHGAVTRPAREAASPGSIVEFTDGEYQWRVAGLHEAALEAWEIDWFSLEECPDATLVKRNSHRDVWHVARNDADYFAKLYRLNGTTARIKLFLRGATAMREWDVGRYAWTHSIAAVVPVAAAWTGAGGRSGPSLFITEAVAGAEPLNKTWLRIRDDRRASNALTDSLARLIARAHQCGFQHDDMHPGNILVRPNGCERETFFVDLHKVRIGRPVGFKPVVANLAQLNQWFRRNATRTQLRRFLKHYLAYRDRFAQASPFARNLSIEPAELIAELAVQADRHARRLWSKRDRRTRRTGRYFARVRPLPGWRGYALLQSKHPAPTACAARLTYSIHQWEQWLAEPLSWVDPDKHGLLKDSHTATVCDATLPTDAGSVKVVVKRPLARSPWKRLGQMFGWSRNLRAWWMANMLLNRGLPVAQPLAVVERYAAGIIRLDSIGFTDFVAGSADLETFLTRDVAAQDPMAQRRIKNRLIDSVVGLLRRFHARGFVHRDFKAPNVLVNWDPPYDGNPRLTLIDMDGVRHVRRSSEPQRIRAVVRLCASLLSSPACTRTDRLRFLKRHLTGPGRAPTDWKAQWRLIESLVAVKMQDKEARRRWKLGQYGRE
ncbi:MAG: hypothetical protein JXQ75_09565 [Phycisphaerae bacterium]|nr:hypothetical protein [Phycisphaerae bacterium]